MKQTLLLGLGGTGSRVVNNVARMLQANAREINDGKVACAVLDTNVADTSLIRSTGTEIPVIETSSEKVIDEYLAKYAHKSPRTWCPYSRSFGAESMTTGASEMRIKSRIALMDTMEDSKILELERVIGELFHDREDPRIRVMLVSSLSGGTGSGMFIQIALWLRKFFEGRNCQVSIRGIFLLPDVFIRTVSSIRQNPRKKLYHYANAYAAIRELNAINKVIQKGYRPEKPIVIDGLFDSDHPCQSPVLDFSFFIDDIDSRGDAFDNIATYEEMTAQLVYMQLYAPMIDELVSVEDNLYRALEHSSEPVFGSCGTAKAVYPQEDVLEYCALRAAQESMVQGWNKIDSEIDAMIQEEREAEKDGVITEQKVSRRDMFVKLFDEKSTKTGKKIGRGERLFVAIRKDIFNEHRENTEKGIVEILECKIASFMEQVDRKIQQVVTERGGCEDILSIGEGLPDPKAPDNFPEGIVDTLKSIRSEEEAVVTRVIEDFEKNNSKYAEEILRALLPLDMGAVNEDNDQSVYGLFMKQDMDGGKHYVHPIAARYLLYKLLQEIEKRQKLLTPVTRRQAAMDGDEETSFDNTRTRKTEDREKYWDQVGWHISKAEIQHFIERYIEYNLANKTLCAQYEAELLTGAVLSTLADRVTDLVSNMENFFKQFPLMEDQLQREIDANVEKNERNAKKIIYVNAQRKFKSAKYESLGVDVTGRNDDLNKSVVMAVYGKFCYDLRPNVKENKEYAEKSIIRSFHDQLLVSFKKLIEKDFKDQIFMNICRAIAEESDIEAAQQRQEELESDPFSDESQATKTAARHLTAVRRYLSKLDNMAAPFLNARPESSLNNDGTMTEIIMRTSTGQMLRMPIQTELTFWGFHPATVKDYPELETELGTNKATSANSAYGINEIYCYRSVYGIQAASVPKFNETHNGDYFVHYDSVINGMIRDQAEVDTPHLDKTWHEFLPYVSAEKQKAANVSFYTNLWRAIAYGRLSLDNHGKYVLSRRIANDFGGYSINTQQLTHDGRAVDTVDIRKLVSALRVEPIYEMEIVPELKADYEEDIRDMTTYVDTKIISGLLSQTELNPVTMIVRYSASRNSDPALTSQLVGSLEAVLRDVADHYNMNRTAAQVEEAMYRLCYRLYNAAGRTQGKAEVFASWVQRFKDMKLQDIADDVQE